MHRYGRHGPGAWLRRHRKMSLSLHPTIPLDWTIVVRQSAYILAEERIIVIIMPHYGYREDEDQDQDQSDVANYPHTSPTLRSVVSPVDAALLNDAKQDASEKARGFIHRVVTRRKMDKTQPLPWVAPREGAIADQVTTDFLAFSENRQLTEAQENFLQGDYRDTFYESCRNAIRTRIQDGDFTSDEEIALHDYALEDRRANPDRQEPAITQLTYLRAFAATGIDPTLPVGQLDFAQLSKCYALYKKHYDGIRHIESEVSWRPQATFSPGEP